MTTSETSSYVAAQATQKDVVRTDQTLVLGVFGHDSALTALVRMPSGRVQKITPGKRLNGRVVRAIDKNGIVVQKNGELQRLPLE